MRGWWASTGLEPRTPVPPSKGLALSLALTFPSNGGAPDLGEGAPTQRLGRQVMLQGRGPHFGHLRICESVGEMAEASARPSS